MEGRERERQQFPAPLQAMQTASSKPRKNCRQRAKSGPSFRHQQKASMTCCNMSMTLGQESCSPAPQKNLTPTQRPFFPPNQHGQHECAHVFACPRLISSRVEVREGGGGRERKADTQPHACINWFLLPPPPLLHHRWERGIKIQL